MQAFCWLCGGATGRAHTWTSIENHSCGRYKDEAEERVSVWHSRGTAAAVVYITHSSH